MWSRKSLLVFLTVTYWRGLVDTVDG